MDLHHKNMWNEHSTLCRNGHGRCAQPCDFLLRDARQADAGTLLSVRTNQHRRKNALPPLYHTHHGPSAGALDTESPQSKQFKK